jgi:hypothetical protein
MVYKISTSEKSTKTEMEIFGKIESRLKKPNNFKMSIKARSNDSNRLTMVEIPCNACDASNVTVLMCRFNCDALNWTL